MTCLQNLNENGVALQGYDPVSYFLGEPLQGNEAIATTYQGAIYHFASVENQTTFEAAPQRYTPQYGGFCAVAVSEGQTFPVDPKTYIIANERLYLFYNGKLGSTKPKWESDSDTRRANADSHWQSGDIQIIYPTVEY